MSIQLRHISKGFGSFTAVKDVSLDVPSGELVALLGPSGSGKTTLLRLIAGIEAPDRGQILFHGKDYTDRAIGERKVGFVFQHYALFRHMTIFDNIAFGLQIRPRKLRPSKIEIRERVHELLTLVQLDGFAERYPTQLSGGQRQRVALARALAVEPELLLLDEPFGALDAKVRQELRRWLRELHEKLNITTVFVTHDQEEALEMADRVVVMNEGQIEQIGTPEEVYHSPANPFVFNFLGRVNLFHGRAVSGKLQVGKTELEIPAEVDINHVEAIGYIRPHEIKISRKYSEKTAVPATIRHISSAGPIIRLTLLKKDSNEAFEVEINSQEYRELALRVGEIIFVDLRNIKVYMKNPERRLAPCQAEVLEMRSVGG